MPRGYNPRVGQMVADFVEHLHRVEPMWPPQGSPERPTIENELVEYGMNRGLTSKQVHTIAKELEGVGWPIDSDQLYTEKNQVRDLNEILEEKNVFDKYLDAIREERYEDAHKIYEAMTPSQQQVIKDRRAKYTGPKKEGVVFNKLNKLAEKAKRAGWTDIVNKIAGLWEDYPKAMWMQYEQVLRELKQLEDRNGSPELKDELLRTKKKMEEKMKGIITEEAEEIINPTSNLGKFRQALVGEDWEAAREYYDLLSPEDKEKADNIAKGIFKVSETAIQLHRIGKALFDKKRYADATEINKMVQALMPMMAPEGQQLVLLIVDPESMGDFPQAFQAQGPVPEDKLKEMKERAMPSCEAPPAPCGAEEPPMLPAPVAKLLDLADRLDKKGMIIEADAIDRWLKTAHYSEEDIRELLDIANSQEEPTTNATQCQTCGADILYRGKDKPKHCRQCLKDPWSAARMGPRWAAKKGAAEADIPPKKEDIEPGDAFEGNIEKESIDNTNYRKVLYTGKNLQLVVMSLKPNEDVGVETHEAVDQFFRIEDGEAKFVIQGKEDYIAKDGDSVLVPMGTRHNIVNTSSDKELKLYTLYSPPNHPVKTIHITKEDAMKAGEMAKEAGFLVVQKKKKTKTKKDNHGGKPKKVVEIADAIRRDNPNTSDSVAYRMAWETYCSYTNPSHSGCTEKGKSKRKSPKPYSKSSLRGETKQSAVSNSIPLYVDGKYAGDLSQDRAYEYEQKGYVEVKNTEDGLKAFKVKQPIKKE